jgi:hypothetical protein
MRQWPAILLVVLLYGVIELGSYGVLSYYRHLDPRYFQASPTELAARVSDTEIEIFDQWLADPVLGWDFRPGWRQRWRWNLRIGADGARYDPAFPDAPPDVDVYGASFVVCDEVNNIETWEHYLSLSLGRHVANFGVFGYSPDQALLKYKTKHAQRTPRPSIVILAITAEEIARIINRYKQFYSSGIVPIGLKPRFVLEAGQLRLIPSSATGAITRNNLPALIEASKADDSWRDRQVAFAWPYSISLAKLLPVAVADGLSIDIPALGILPRDLWRSPSATQLLRALIDDFVATAKERAATPVILFIPAAPRPGTVPPYVPFVKQLRHDLPRSVLVVDVAEASFDPQRFSVRLFAGHASPYGNRVIADHVRAALAAARLAAGPS